MGVRKEGKYWRVQIQRGGQSYSTTFSTQREAKQYESAIIEAHKLGRTGASAKHTIAEAFIKWAKEELPTQKAKDKTKNHAAQLYPFIKNQPITELDQLWQDYKESVNKPRNITRYNAIKLVSPASTSTMNKKGAIVRRIANLAYKRWGWLDNPIHIELLPVKKREKVTIRKNDIGELLDAIKKDDARALFKILFYSGMRIGEALRAEVKDGYFVLADTKNGKAHRVKVHADLTDAITHIPFKHKYHYYYGEFVEAREAINRPELTPHKMRHSFASHLLNNGVDLKTVSQLLNHSSVSITADLYGDIYNENLDKAIDRF